MFKFNFYIHGIVYLFMAMLVAGCGGAGERQSKYLQRGKDLIQQKNYDKAILEFKNVLQINPKSYEAIYYIANVNENQKQYQRAMAGYSKAIELNPEFTDAQVAVGRLYLLANLVDKAIEYANAVLAKTPGSADALVVRAGARLKQSQLDAALDDVRQAIDMQPDHLGSIALLSRIYLMQEQAGKAEALMSSALERSPENDGLRSLLIQFYMETKNLPSAITQLQKLIEKNQQLFAYRTQLAALYNALDDTDKAEQVLRLAVKDMPDNLDAKKILIQYLLEKRDLMFAQVELSRFQKDDENNPELKLISALLYQKSNDIDQAEEIYKMVIRQYDDEAAGVAARYEYARLLLGHDRKEDAKQQLQDLLAKNPTHNDALVLRSMLAIDDANVDGAISDLRTVLNDQPSSVKVMKLLAQAYLISAKNDLAQEQLVNVLRESPADIVARIELAKILFSQGQYAELIEQLGVVEKIEPDHLEARQLTFKAYLAQSDFEKAMQLAQTLQVAYPNDAMGYYYQGLALQAQKKYQQSMDMFLLALDKSPQAIGPLSSLVRAAFAAGQEARAIKELNKIVAGNANHAIAHNLLGEVYSSQKKHIQAIEAYSKSIAVNDSWWIAYRNLAATHLLLKHEQQAIEVYQQGIASATQKDQLIVSLAQLHEKRGEVELAIKVYENVLKTKPDSMFALNNLALLLVDNNKDKVSLDKALALLNGLQISNNAANLDTLGWVHYRRGEFDMALSALLQASQVMPESLLIYYHLGSVYYSKGNKTEARKYLEPVLKSNMPFKGKQDVQRMMDEINQQA